jgi:hypothetical protein
MNLSMIDIAAQTPARKPAMYVSARLTAHIPVNILPFNANDNPVITAHSPSDIVPRTESIQNIERSEILWAVGCPTALFCPELPSGFGAGNCGIGLLTMIQLWWIPS